MLQFSSSNSHLAIAEEKEIERIEGVVKAEKHLRVAENTNFNNMFSPNE